MIPYFAWLFIVHPLFLQGGAHFNLNDYGRYFSQYVLTNHGLWFLPCLFFLMCGFSLYLYCRARLKKCGLVYDVGVAVVVQVVFVLLYKMTGCDFMRTPASYTAPFFVGVLIAFHASLDNFFTKSSLVYTISLIVFCIAAGFYMQGIEEADCGGKLYRMVAGLASVPLAFRLARSIEERYTSCSIVSYVSKNTLIIYVMQNAFIYSCHVSNPHLKTIPQVAQLCLAIAVSLMAMVICLFAGYVISKSNFLSYLLLGKRAKHREDCK